MTDFTRRRRHDDDDGDDDETDDGETAIVDEDARVATREIATIATIAAISTTARRKE